MKLQNLTGARTAEVDPGTLGVYTTHEKQRGIGFSATGISGQVPANFAANSNWWAMRNGFGGPSREGVVIQLVDRIRVKYTVVSNAVSIATNRIALFRGGGTQPITLSGGTAMVPANKHPLRAPNTGQNSASYADMRIMTTASLTMTNVTFETNPLRGYDMTGPSLTLGNFLDWIWEFSAYENQALQLLPGQCLALRNPIVAPNMFHQIQVDVDYREVLTDPAYSP